MELIRLQVILRPLQGLLLRINFLKINYLILRLWKAQLDDKKVFIEIDDDARLWLAENGYDSKMGARPMDRLIQEKIKKPLAEEVLFGSLAQKGGTAFVSVEDGELVVSTEVNEKELA